MIKYTCFHDDDEVTLANTGFLTYLNDNVLCYGCLISSRVIQQKNKYLANIEILKPD